MADKEPEDKAVLAVAAFVQIATIIVEPFIVKALWFWYVVPMGLAPLTWARAFGLNLIVGVLVYRWPGERTNEQTLTACVSTFMAGVLALAIGWTVLKVTA